jgi:UDP-glucose 4-epimerase
MKVLVTGAHGFLGRYVSKEFAKRGHEVTGIGHGIWSSEYWTRWGLTAWNGCDITEKSLSNFVHDPDIVIHCAGGSSVEYSISHTKDDFKRTTLTTLSLLEFLKTNYRDAIFVYPSSMAVYGNKKSLPVNESFSLQPISPYGTHKKMAEEHIQSYSQFYGIKSAIVRFPSLYGPGLRKQLLWDACIKIQDDNLKFYGTGEEIRDWLHVTDAARLIYALTLKMSDETQIVNGGTGIGTTVADTIRMISTSMGEKRLPQFSQVPKEGDPLGYIADITKAKLLGWEPKISIEEGIREYVQWFREGAL